MESINRHEDEFEHKLIEKLCTGEVSPFTPGTDVDFNQIFRSKLWEYRGDIKTTSQLEQNFKEILEHNNQETLDGPLSTSEFKQVMDQINDLNTPYKAGRFLYGYHGVSQVEVTLDNGRHVYLTVFDQSQVGAGNTVYQVVNQIERPAVIPGYPDARFDVTLLINGLPIYQIELKGPDNDVDTALNQLERYVKENQFSGIFSTVQILMGMTPYNTKYMARTTPEEFNKEFAFHWKDADNNNVRKWEDIADHVLTIPAAHQLATNYLILDGSKSKESIKVMRSYQVTATRLALERLRATDFSMGLNKDGYIWHTTGSGKTITSYKTAALANRLPNVDKVVFLVDRKSLTKQTLDCYRGYDPDASMADEIKKYTGIEETSNTNQLSRKLKSKNDGIIITSTQKLQRLVKREKFKAPDKHLLFIVDEAHRSTGTDVFSDIQKAFPHSAWIGYSGTPIFDEKLKGRRTVDVFGPLIHAYTIRDAIADKNVLGFKVEFNTTVPDETKEQQLIAYYRKLQPDWTDEQIKKKIGSLSPEDMDDSLRGSFYDNNQMHVEAVVRDIVTHWENRSNNWKYNALLTTHVGGGKASIPMALMYYEEFKKQNEEREKAGLRPIKVAISISADETNGDRMNDTNSKLKAAMDDYNKMFNSHYGLDTVYEYNMDLEDRLRKASGDGNYLDLVIVVDRLLTGFDAPELNTLYVDRTLKGAGLIQAYSRTNRIHHMNDKPFGNVVNYRWPEYAEELMNDALAVYSNKENADLSPEEKKKVNEDDGITTVSYEKQVEKTVQLIERIKDMTYGFERIPSNPEKQDQLLGMMRQYNSQIAKLKQYPPKFDGDIMVEGFDYHDPDHLFTDLGISEDDHHLITITLGNELKGEISRRKHISPQLIDLRVEHLKDVTVDYDFLTKLLEDLLNQIHDNKMEVARETKEKIHEFSNALEDRSYAKQVDNATEAIYTREYPKPDSGLTYPYRLTGTSDLMKNIENAQIAYVDHQMLDFRRKWGLEKIVDSGTMRRLISSHEFGQNDLNKNIIADIVRKASNVYKEDSCDEQIRSLPKLRYRNELRAAIKAAADAQASE